MPVPGFPIHPEVSTRESSHEGVRIREDTLYTNARGQEKGGIRKRAQKAVAQLKDALLRALDKDETVLYVARAQVLPSQVEQFFLGWLAYTTQRGVLVFTNHRLIYLITNQRGKWQRSIRSVPLGDIKEAKVKGWLQRTLRIKYRSGAHEAYWQLRWQDANKIKVLLAALLPASSSETSSSRETLHLCPDCFVALTVGVYKCSHCGVAFKDEKTMVRRSLMFPGLGYLYAGHAGLAVLDLLLEAFVLWEILISILIALRVVVPLRPPGEPPVGEAWAWISAGVFMAILGLKKWLTIRHCRRFIMDYIPAK